MGMLVVSSCGLAKRGRKRAIDMAPKGVSLPGAGSAVAMFAVAAIAVTSYLDEGLAHP